METNDNVTDNQKILIVQIGKLGDMILTTPLFSNLKEIYPKSEITVLSSPINFEIPRYHKDVDKIHIYKKGSLKTISVLMKLRQSKFDLWIDTKPEYSRTSRTLLKYSKPKKSFGYNKDDMLFDVDLTQFKNGNHAVDINLAPIKAIITDFIINNKLPSIHIPGGTSHKIKPFLDSLKKQKVFVNISAGKTNRIWGLNNWKALLSYIIKDEKYDVILSAHGQIDNLIAKDILKELNNDCIHLQTGTYMEIAELVKNSDIVISPDTAIIHMASAFNVPIIDLFTNVEWNIERFSPLSDKSVSIIAEDSNSFKGITPDKAYRAFEKLIST